MVTLCNHSSKTPWSVQMLSKMTINGKWSLNPLSLWIDVSYTLVSIGRIGVCLIFWIVCPDSPWSKCWKSPWSPYCSTHLCPTLWLPLLVLTHWLFTSVNWKAFSRSVWVGKVRKLLVVNQFVLQRWMFLHSIRVIHLASLDCLSAVLKHKYIHL